MKKNTFGLLALSMLLCFGTASCSDESSSITSETTSTPAPVNPLPSTLDYVKQNLVEDEDDLQDPVVIKDVTYVGEQLKDLRVHDDYSQKGFYIVINDAGFIGVYSITHNKMLMECQYYYEWLDYRVIQDAGPVTLIRFDYENKTKIIDVLGNVFYDGEQLMEYTPITSTVINNKIYVINSINEDYAFQVYSDGSLLTVEALPEIEIPDIKDDDDDALKVGDLFIEGGVKDLKEYGNPGYFLLTSKTGITTLFNDTSKLPIVTFTIPTDVKPVVVGSSIYYQRQLALPEDAINFDFSRNEHKYGLQTYQIDILTGETHEFDLDYVASDIKEYKDSTGIKSLGLLTCEHINEYKTLDDKQTLLFNDKNEIIADVTSLGLDSFKKLENSYYNEQTKILYNDKLEVITYLENLNAVYSKEKKLFIGSTHGKHGAIDTNGKIVIPFIYDEIYYDNNYSFALLENGNDYELYNFANPDNSLYYQDVNLRWLDHSNQIFALENTANVTYFTLNGEITSYYFVNEEAEKPSLQFENSRIIGDVIDDDVLYVNYRFGGENHSHILRIGDSVNINPFGSENKVTPRTGRSYEDAIITSVGENMIHANPSHHYNNATYLVFNPSTTGIYSFDTANNMYLDSIKCEYSTTDSYGDINTNYQTISPINDENGINRYALAGGRTYYICLNFEGYKSFTINQDLTALNFVDGKETAPIDTYFAREIKAYKDSYYKISCEAEKQLIVIGNDGRSNTANYIGAYNDGLIYHVSEGNILLAIFNKIESGSTINKDIHFTKFDMYDIEKLDNTETIITESVDMHYLRKFSVIESGKYMIKADCRYEILKYNSLAEDEKFTRVDINTNYNGFGLIDLESSTTYIIIMTANNTGDSINASLVKATFNNIEEIKLDIEYDTIPNKYIAYRFVCNETADYFIEKDSYVSVSFYEYDQIRNTKSIVNDHYVFGQQVFPLERGKTYLVYGRNSNSYYNYGFTIKKFDINSVPELENSKYYDGQVGDQYTRINVPTSGFYKILSDSSSVSMNVSQYQINSGNSLLAVNHQYYDEQGNKIYYFDHLKTYIVTTNSSYSYTLTLTFVGENDGVIPGYYTTNMINFVKDSSGNYSSVRVPNSGRGTMTFCFQKSGTFEFLYDIESEAGCDRISISKDGYSVSVPHDSGRYLNNKMTFEVQKGTTIVITYRKDSSYAQYSDRAYLHDIKFTPDNSLTLKIKDIPADFKNANKAIMWAWDANNAGAWYESTYNEMDGSYTFIVPNETTGFLIGMVFYQDTTYSWDSLSHKSNNVTIVNGQSEYSLASGWEK